MLMSYIGSRKVSSVLGFPAIPLSFSSTSNQTCSSVQCCFHGHLLALRVLQLCRGQLFKSVAGSSGCILEYNILTEIFVQPLRSYASAAPTAAFAGQKGPNVSNGQRHISEAPKLGICTRENTRSPSFLGTVGLPSCLVRTHLPKVTLQVLVQKSAIR